jgi:2-aminoethylphosphonate-pyruvate transaminase
MDMTAVILAAGQGKRFKNLSEFIHKCLIEVESQPLICYSIDKLVSVGFKSIIVVVGFKSEVLIKYLFSKYGDAVNFVVNKEFESSGNFLSLHKALTQVKHDCFVLDADIIYEKKALLEALDEKRSNFFITTNLSNLSDSVLVKILNGLVIKISKNITLQQGSNLREYIGILKLDSEVVKYIQNIDIEKFNEYDYEEFLDAHTINKYNFGEVYVPKLIWAEVDNETDLMKIKNWDMSIMTKATCI